MTKIKLTHYSLVTILFMASCLNGQGLVNFLGHWTGIEELDSPSLSYDNRNISIQVMEGGERDGFYIYSSSSDFLYNETLSWAYHYFGFDKETTQIIFLRRFITPLGVLGYEEMLYDLTEWTTESFVADHTSDDGASYHQIRMDLNLLHLFELTPKRVNLSQNFPNPFNPSTTIDVIMEENAQGSLIIYNINGQEVQTLHKGEFSSGITQFLWNGRDNLGRPVSGGTYIYRLMVGGSAGQSQKMILLK